MSRQTLAKLITLSNEDLKKVTILTHKGADPKTHTQLLPQQIDKLEWEDEPDAGAELSDFYSILKMALDDVPLDHNWFTMKFEGETVLTDQLYGTSHRRFYEWDVSTASRRSSYFMKPGREPGPGDVFAT